MAGPPKKPTALKKLEGTFDISKANTREPKPTLGATPPDYLKDDQRDDFLALAEKFNASKLLTVLDGPVLALLCELYSDYRKLKAIIDEYGFMVEHTATGGIKVQKLNPVAPQLNKVRDQILAILREFGATPASRARVSELEEVTGESDPLEEYLKLKGIK